MNRVQKRKQIKNTYTFYYDLSVWFTCRFYRTSYGVDLVVTQASLSRQNRINSAIAYKQALASVPGFKECAALTKKLYYDKANI